MLHKVTSYSTVVIRPVPSASMWVKRVPARTDRTPLFLKVSSGVLNVKVQVSKVQPQKVLVKAKITVFLGLYSQI